MSPVLPFAPMTTVRRKLTVKEVSLCRNPANPGARVALFKSDQSHARNTMDKTKLSDEARAYVDSLEKSAEEAEAKAKEAEAKAAEADAKAKEAEAKLAEKGGNEPDPEPVNKDELPDNVRKALEKSEAEADEARKAAEDLAKSVKSSEERIAKMEEAALDADIDAFIKSVPVTAAGQDDLHDTLKSLPTDARSKMMDMMKAQEEKAASILKTVGADGESEIGGEAFEKLEAKAAEIQQAEPSLSKEQAFAKAVKDNRDLAKQYHEERRAAH